MPSCRCEIKGGTVLLRHKTSYVTQHTDLVIVGFSDNIFKILKLWSVGALGPVQTGQSESMYNYRRTYENKLTVPI